MARQVARYAKRTSYFYPVISGILLILVMYLYYCAFCKETPPSGPVRELTRVAPAIVVGENGANMNTIFAGGISTRQDTFNDPYSPPLKNDGVYFPRDSVSSDSVPRDAVPINIQSRGYSLSYTQVGILTKDNEGNDMILPLMGRRIMNGRQKYQYYAISNTGTMNTKLPIRFRGKNASGEYGCDELTTGDTVYVEGYNQSFRATIYENALFSYIPVL